MKTLFVHGWQSTPGGLRPNTIVLHSRADEESAAMMGACERCLKGNQGTVERSDDDGTQTQGLDDKPR